MIRLLISLVVMFACDIGAMKNNKKDLRSSTPNLISTKNESKSVSSHRIITRAASADSEDTNSKKNLDPHKKFTRSDDTTSSSTSSHVSSFSITLPQVSSGQVSSRSSSKSPKELKTSLVESSKNIKKFLDLDDKNQKIGYELCAAIKKNNFSRVIDILYFDVNNPVGEEGKTPLIVAVEKGNRDIVSEFLGYAGIDVNKSDNSGETPLMIAIEKRHNDIALELLGCVSIDVNKSDGFGKTPLIIAIQKLIDLKSSSINELVDFDEVEKMSSTINDNAIALIQRLLKQEGIDINKADNRKNAPLHHVVLKHNETVIKLLLRDHRVNSELRNSDGRLANQLIDDQCYQDVSEIKVLFFNRSTLDRISATEILALKMISANEKSDAMINQTIAYIKEGIDNDHKKQKKDRKLPEMESLFLEDDFLKKMIIYRLKEGRQVANESNKIEIIINNSDAI